MKRTGIALLSAAALLGSVSANAAGASDISWTFLEAGWITADGDDFNSTDGFEVAGSLGFLDHFFFQAGYSGLNSDSESTVSGLDVDTDTWTVQVGYYTELTSQSQWYAGIGYFSGNAQTDEIDGGEGGVGLDADTDGFTLKTGVRYRPADSFEFGGELVYADGDTDGSGDFNDTSVGIYGQYYIIPAWSVGARASLSGGGGGLTATSGDALTLYTRYDFGNLFDK